MQNSSNYSVILRFISISTGPHRNMLWIKALGPPNNFSQKTLLEGGIQCKNLLRTFSVFCKLHNQRPETLVISNHTKSQSAVPKKRKGKELVGGFSGKCF